MAESLAGRLDRHFVACSAVAAAAAVGGVVQTSDASIVYSGVLNVPIPNTFGGIYTNIATGVSQTSRPTGWDINPYFGSTGLAFYGNPNTGPADQTGFVVTGTAATNLTPGTIIDGSSTYSSGVPFPTADGSMIPPGTTGIIGFRFLNEGDNANHYGWARIQNLAAGSGAVLVDYGWENTGAGIPAGAVPAPGALALLALGGAGLASRRRK